MCRHVQRVSLYRRYARTTFNIASMRGTADASNNSPALQHSFSTPHFIIIRSVARLRYLLDYCRCEFLACILFRMRGTVLVVVDSARDTKDSSVTTARESTSQVIT